jgi:Vacuolar protein sorting-associated protein 62
MQGQVLPLKLPSMDWRLVCVTPQSPHTDDVASIWRPIGAPRYCCIGDVLRKGRDPPSGPVTMYLKNPQASKSAAALFAFPLHYLLVWRECGRGGMTLWRAQAPEGYSALGCIAANGLDPPARTAMVCVREVRRACWHTHYFPRC